MYKEFFQFSAPPFNLTPDTQFFYFSHKHEDAFSNLLYGIKERKGFMAITGEVGTGKTTLCRLLLKRLDANIKTSLIFNPNLTTIELLQAINQDFGIKNSFRSKKRLVDELNNFLLKELTAGGNAVLIIDEAQNLRTECMEEIRLLSNLETEREKLIQIILMGQPELNAKLSLKSLRQLDQRISIRYNIRPLDVGETRDYITHRIKTAGNKDTLLFTSDSINKIHQFTKGVPRLINIVCDKALLAAYVSELKIVTGNIIEKAIDDLNVERNISHIKRQEGTKKGRRGSPENRKQKERLVSYLRRLMKKLYSW
ncbi:MAG: ExeA family protein [Nitrospirota bacterium]